MPVTAHTTWGHVAGKLAANGYMPVPVVRGAKHPAIKGFLDYRYTPADDERYSHQSVGILTGHGLVGVDLDITDEALCEEIREKIFALYGETIYRVGNAPKVLLVYRAPAGTLKVKGPEAEGGHIELLGLGQQFVAFGTHPATNKPYAWPGLLGSPLEVSAIDLPALTADGVQTVASLLGEARSRTTADLGDDFAADTPVGMEMSEARSCLSVLCSDDRDRWITVGMALHHEYGGDIDAYLLWDEWSRQSSKYKEGDTETAWVSFGRRTDSLVTVRTVRKWAKDEIDHRRRAASAAVVQILMSDIEACTEPADLLNSIAPRVSADGVDAAMQLVLRDHIAKRFRALTDTALKADTLDAALSSGTLRKHPCTEVGNTARMLEAHGDDIMYCAETDTWYRWDGSRWCPCVRELILRLAGRTVATIGKEAAADTNVANAKALSKWAKASEKASMRESMLKIAQVSRGVLVPAKALDGDVDYLGVANGSVHLPTGVLIEPCRNHRLTLNTGIPYSPDARAPLFEQTVLDVFNDDEELAGFLQRVVGYALTGRPEKEEIMVLPEGRGANGKSTLFNALHFALGAYARFASAETFISARQQVGGAAREDVLRLRGSRFVYVTEVEESGVLKESVVKCMTGGELIPARGLYSRHSIEVQPTWIVFMPTNHLPIVKGEDKGIWRKLIVLPFHRDFTNDPVITKDVNRKLKLKAEAAGILRWCIDGARMYLTDGLNVPTKVMAATTEYRAEMDLLTDWLSVCCEIGAYTVSGRDLWRSWQQYAIDEGTHNLVPSSNALTRRLRARGFGRAPGTRDFTGLRLKATEFN